MDIHVRQVTVFVMVLSLVAVGIMMYLRFAKSKPRDCKLTAWSDWKGCHMQACNAGKEIRVRGVKQTPKFGGKSCPTDKRQYVQSRFCRNGSCQHKKTRRGPKDCQYTEWGPYSECPNCTRQPCNFPVQYRTRKVKNAPKKGGIPCRWEEMVETRLCWQKKNATKLCPSKQNCVFGDWQLKQKCPSGILCLNAPHNKPGNNPYHEVWEKAIKQPAKAGGKCNISKQRKVKPCSFDACPDCPPIARRKECNSAGDCSCKVAFSRCSRPCTKCSDPTPSSDSKKLSSPRSSVSSSEDITETTVMEKDNSDPYIGVSGTQWAPRTGTWSPKANIGGGCPQFKVRKCCTTCCPTAKNPDQPACLDDTDVEIRIDPEWLKTQNITPTDTTTDACNPSNVKPESEKDYQYRVVVPRRLQRQYPHVFQSTSQKRKQKSSFSSMLDKNDSEREPAALTSWLSRFPTEQEMAGRHVYDQIRQKLLSHGVSIA